MRFRRKFNNNLRLDTEGSLVNQRVPNTFPNESFLLAGFCRDTQGRRLKPIVLHLFAVQVLDFSVIEFSRNPCGPLRFSQNFTLFSIITMSYVCMVYWNNNLPSSGVGVDDEIAQNERGRQPNALRNRTFIFILLKKT